MRLPGIATWPEYRTAAGEGGYHQEDIRGIKKDPRGAMAGGSFLFLKQAADQTLRRRVLSPMLSCSMPNMCRVLSSMLDVGPAS